MQINILLAAIVSYAGVKQGLWHMAIKANDMERKLPSTAKNRAKIWKEIPRRFYQINSKLRKSLLNLITYNVFTFYIECVSLSRARTTSGRCCHAQATLCSSHVPIAQRRIHHCILLQGTVLV